MFDFYPQLKQRFDALRTRAEFFSLRYVRESGQYLSVRKHVAEPPSFNHDQGAMLTVRINGVEAYAATNDLSQAGLQAALERAEAQAGLIAAHTLLDLSQEPVSGERADYCSPNLDQPFPSLSECFELLSAESAAVPNDERLVSWEVGLGLNLVEIGLGCGLGIVTSAQHEHTDAVLDRAERRSGEGNPVRALPRRSPLSGSPGAGL